MGMFNDIKDSLRGNPKLKPAGYKEFVSKDVIIDRLEEMKKIMDDPIYFAQKYFYIINSDEGKQLIKVYPKQAEMINAMCNNQRVICLAVRQCGKSTSYSIFCLWYVLTNKDKCVLICANKFGTAKDILARIQMAYQELPSWMKPGIKEWNRGSIIFDNGCKISAEATSGNSGRGGTVNCLICDEFAFVKPGCEEEFLQSVFPVVSSSKNSKIIIVSTPHGMGNEFYRIWTRATLETDNGEDTKISENLKWHPVKVEWNEVPGRDEEWKKQQLESFGNNMSRFLQEYGNSFLGSTETLISSEKIKSLKDTFFKNHVQGKEIQLHKEFPSTKIRMYHPPEKNHAYVIGADPSMGMDSDYQAMSVWDITNTYNIKQVASFYENSVQPKIFAYILSKTGKIYNDAYVAIENNGCSQVTLDSLWRDYEYDYIINEGGNPKTNIGIHSMNARKMEACLNFKIILEDNSRNIEINDGRLIAELEKFERKTRVGKLPTYEALDGHDDYAMATIWGFFVLKLDILESYYDVKKIVLNKLNEQIPLYIIPFANDFEIEEPKRDIFDLDNKLNSFVNADEKLDDKIRNVDTNIDIDKFIKDNNLSLYDEDAGLPANNDNENNDNFQFDVF